MHRVVVIGGGASGMMAAYFSAFNGNQTILLEKNEKLGKKLYITGKGRCNLTNTITVPEFINNVVTNPKFIYSSLNAFSPTDTIDFFQSRGLKLKTERGNRVFPESDKASDVTKTIKKALQSVGVEIKLNCNVTSIDVKNGGVFGVNTSNGYLPCDSVIVCTGGVSYHLTGSTGDGYAFAESVGHKIIRPKPSLVGIELKDDLTSLQGLSLKNVALTATMCGKKVYDDFGEMLFTHYGVSGPIILSCSCVINKLPLNDILLKIDLKPALDNKLLDNRLLRELEIAKHKEIKTAIRTIVPASLVAVILNRSRINTGKKCGDITKENRRAIIDTLKNFELHPLRLRPIDEAIVTSGGVCVDEINPKTMESKIIRGMFFAGEVLDVDCFTGGFNIQTAFSTGYIAGKNA